MTNTPWYNEFFSICSALECKSWIYKEEFNMTASIYLLTQLKFNKSSISFNR